MPTDRTDEKNFSTDPIMEMCGAYMTMLASQPEDCRDGVQAMAAAVRELRQFFRELGGTAPVGSDLMVLCSTVSSGLTTQVLEPHEERSHARTG